MPMLCDVMMMMMMMMMMMDDHTMIPLPLRL